MSHSLHFLTTWAFSILLMLAAGTVIYKSALNQSWTEAWRLLAEEFRSSWRALLK